MKDLKGSSIDPLRARSTTQDLLASLAIGLCLGWIAGLSLSPVIQSVLAALLTAVGTLVAVISGLGKDKPARVPTIRPWPLVALMFGVAVGGPIGIVARETRFTFKMQQVPRAYSEKPAEARVEEPKPMGTTATRETSHAKSSFGLYASIPTEDCDSLRGASMKELRKAFQVAGSAALRATGDNVDSTDTLDKIRQGIIGDPECDPNQ